MLKRPHCFIFILLFVSVISVADTENIQPENKSFDHYTKKVFRSHENELVKKNRAWECLTGEDPNFNLTTDYDKFNSLNECLYPTESSTH